MLSPVSALRFDITHQDTSSRARVGRVTTPHGWFDTPAFMPVGTQGTIKGILPELVAQTGAQIVLGNTYHLMLRPGSDLVQRMGGLQHWTRWGRPMLTDSGGFQVFSLADISKINDDGVTFKSHLDGALHELTPERSMQVQNELGADIIMAFDDCPPAQEMNEHQAARAKGFDSSPDSPPTTSARPRVDPTQYAQRVRLANERTLRWLDRCVAAHQRPEAQALFGIVQGGTDLDQRAWCAQRVCAHDLPGYAIGGVAVGEPPDVIRQVVEHTAARLPADRPRYLMGVGYERDLVAAVRAGVDMFDCVLPTRNGRNANAFTRAGQVRLRNATFRDDPRPIEEGCDCPACGGVSEGVSGIGSGKAGRSIGHTTSPMPDAASPGFSRSYLRHLFQAGEILGPVLVSLHNLRHFQRLMLDIRLAIHHNDWSALARHWPVAGLSL
jgi:queuine tRNA-ribosyltransferase